MPGGGCQHGVWALVIAAHHPPSTTCHPAFVPTREENVAHETIGGGKPIVSITHINIVRNRAEGRPEALVAVKQVYASHYLTASLSFTAISDASDSASRYLVYARRSRADVLTGPFAGLIRRTVERRIRSEGPALLDRLRRRLEREPMDGS
jgi:hypothetical protein